MSNRKDTNDRRREAVARLVDARTALGLRTTSTDLQSFWDTRSDVLESDAATLERKVTIQRIHEVCRLRGEHANGWTLDKMSDGDLRSCLNDLLGRTERGE